MNSAEIEAAAMSELRRIFNPEFINRLDEVVVFNQLNRNKINSILDIELNELTQRLFEKNYQLQITPAAREILVEKGWDPKFGGRPLRRTILKEIETPLSELILDGCWDDNTVFTADGIDGAIKINGNKYACVAWELALDF
jgi:ATP-dependent Clp protease ATP-binding subunit ClpC